MADSASNPSSPRGKRKLNADVEPSSGATDAQSKKPRVIGPIMPPAHMVPQADSEDENNSSSSSSSSDDDDDGYGPTLPPAKGDSVAQGENDMSDESDSVGPSAPPASEPTKRDDWMLRPPDQLDFSSRVDPTKLRSRKFNTGRAANAPTGKAVASTWTETAEEKRKRLENEVMGIQAPAPSGESKPQAEDPSRKISEQVKEYNEKIRNKSLYSKHQTKASDIEKDDPSARPFDKEKDIRGPTRINHAQRRELLNKSSSNISSRFSGGKFL
ncbi:hypothetical protein D8B26_001049 [Coccidioides posadasii str. Silveira]|uniref:DUF3752 domain-containing protein n=2 Tax=Coccidioides posadasii TaxID=199306 RepID=C5P2Y7_COCP7|nr:hypothetical protein CPC735_039390 [Coccidioides posadasii C735 delta SOWgp]EER28675.1 hypothetical protein CPC735_039390 [Coccidioides posadasii C735 delta SOWgp]QVM06337.1 hypothetical protein D8B26_001049 [Coccidioides posadasii str. Silveira]|eukprot:XP_003070820.1 hypothetical protein CPC735_039390 [Coccidioides posadasii C735 delta SOWgp]